MPINRLAEEKSPYLLQHAHNPVDWFPWAQAAFDKAKAEDKPIFLSVGYSTCHWCHVMERESFENEAIAKVLNEHFVPVKVDREERPDVDRIYMLFVQANTGQGGWPMSVFLTPQLEPFYGGTYFPPESRYGRPGFLQILEQIAQAWNNDRGRISGMAGQMASRLREAAVIDPSAIVVSPAALDSSFYAFRRSYDSINGGFGSAPKFPRPSVHNFLVRYSVERDNQEALDMVVRTLDAMARGGMHDQLGGGFHRYSVDEKWFVPHFEKMLYDQAQLATSYLEAWQLTHNDSLEQTARSIFAYVQRDMTDPEGAFYSAEDADSVIDPENPDEKGEGAFYIWSWEELERLLGEEETRWFAYRFGAEPGGNVSPAQDPHNEFTGRNILFDAHTVEETAARFEKSPDEMAQFFSQASDKLMRARSERVRPGLDDKILTAWNGLMISAFALGARLLDEERYSEAAVRAADFLIDRMWHPESGTLLRRYREGEAAIDGFLDDYAFFAQALIELYETVFDPRYLRLAIMLTEEMRKRFEDESGGFYSAQESPELIVRMKDDYDSAEPAGNSVALLNLLRLARLADREDFEQSARKALQVFAPRLQEIGHSLPQMLTAAALSLAPRREIVIAGDRHHPAASELLRAIRERFLPFSVIHLVDEQNRKELAEVAPQAAAMTPVDGSPAVYVCQNYACQLPVTQVNELASLLR